MALMSSRGRKNKKKLVFLIDEDKLEYFLERMETIVVSTQKSSEILDAASRRASEASKTFAKTAAAMSKSQRGTR